MFGKTIPAAQNERPNFAESDQIRDRRRSVLHEGITIRGEWHSDGIVDFGGKFDGNLYVETLVLNRSGQINGHVNAKTVTIDGDFTGTIEAHQVVIKSVAYVRADILTQFITIDEGADIAGKISSGTQ
jgi:cytoskeletal protein CcmA (bactofilin family)